MRTIGVLALQGDFAEHIHTLHSLSVDAVEVRLPEQIPDLDGLIIPGGESTTIGKLAAQYKLIEPIRKFIASGKPVWGTCAGMILLANYIHLHPDRDERKRCRGEGSLEILRSSHRTSAQNDKKKPTTRPIIRTALKKSVETSWVGGMDIAVSRNAFGRQIDSFEQPIKIEGIHNSKTPFHAVFIRAPIIAKVGKNVQILAKLPDGTIVAAGQGNVLVTSFHPELTNDSRLHEYFLQI